MNKSNLNNRISRLEQKTAPTQPKYGYYVVMGPGELAILQDPKASSGAQAEIRKIHHLDSHPQRKIYTTSSSPDDWD